MRFRVLVSFVVMVCCFEARGQQRTAGLEVDGSSRLESSSPDGESKIFTTPETDTDDYAHIYLSSHGKRARLLGRYFRSAFLAWGPDGKSIILIDHHSPEDDVLRIFKLDNSGDLTELLAADGKLRVLALGRAGRGGVESYVLKLVRFEGPSRLLIGVHLRYLRYGHSVGPTNAQELEFEFDLNSGRVTSQQIRRE